MLIVILSTRTIRKRLDANAVANCAHRILRKGGVFKREANIGRKKHTMSVPRTLVAKALPHANLGVGGGMGAVAAGAGAAIGGGTGYVVKWNG